VRSTGGTAFDGAAFGDSTVYFPVSGNGAFNGTTLPVPDGVHTVLVTGLAPGGAYGYSVQSNGGANVLNITINGSAVTADAAGLLKVAF
jgi:hypothetical protein